MSRLRLLVVTDRDLQLALLRGPLQNQSDGWELHTDYATAVLPKGDFAIML